MIDLCPVGAITSKPFRYSARTWELSRRKSVSPHDSTGANLIVQVKGAQVMRVLPLENEDVNECWLADRDRFSYEAFNAAERLTAPMIRQGGEWKTVDWTDGARLRLARPDPDLVEHGPQSVGALASPISTVEELHLLAKLVRGLGSENIDTRLREAAPAARRRRSAGSAARSPSLSELQRVLVVGSFLRKDHPLFAQRMRQAAKKGAKVMSVHALRDDWLMPMGPSIAAAPSGWPQALADDRRRDRHAAKGVAAPADRRKPNDEAKAIAAALASGERKAVLLGNAAAPAPRRRRARAPRRAGSPSRPARASAGWSTAATRSARSSSAPQPGEGGAERRARCSAPRRRSRPASC